MKRFVVLAVSTLVCLAALTPSTWAAESTDTSTVAVAGGLAQDLAAPSADAQADAASTAATRPCEDRLEERVVAGTAWACNFGAPGCLSGGQCDSWCWPLRGLCLSGCCACQ